jgi:hypothetical protein
VSGTSVPFYVVSNQVYVRLVANTAPKVAFEGDRIAMFDFEIVNPSPDPTWNADITQMRFYMEHSQNSVPSKANPSTIITRLEVMDITSGSEVPLGVNAAPPNVNPLPDPDPLYTGSVDVNTPVTIAPNSGVARFRVYATLQTDLSRAVVPNLQVRIGDIVGAFENTGPPLTPVDPTDNFLHSIRNDPYYVRSGLSNIRGADQPAFNYPNPFNPSKRSTNIVYFSEKTGNATIKIFTITGQLVRSLTDAASVGSNEVQWDGKNGKGQVVRNGVYVAVIMPPGGSKQVVKIAVVK